MNKQYRIESKKEKEEEERKIRFINKKVEIENKGNRK